MGAALVAMQPAQIVADDPRAWLLRFLDLTNEARRQGQRCGDQLFHSAAPLTWNDQLSVSAQGHVSDMIRLNFRGHVNPETGSTPESRARAAGYPSGEVGENAAYDSVTPEDAGCQALIAARLDHDPAALLRARLCPRNTWCIPGPRTRTSRCHSGRSASGDSRPGAPAPARRAGTAPDR